ncbi:hypothetical protein [Escherichia coli]
MRTAVRKAGITSRRRLLLF